MFSGMAAVQGHARAGKVKLLAVTGKARMAVAPDVPTIAESGYPGFDAVGWFGAIAPARTPNSIVTQLNSEIIQAAQSRDVKERLNGIGFDVVTSSPEAFARYIQSEVTLWRNLAQQMGLKAK
jgi:tripartite-type tricarboxylate transporter receptor subunit TctC